MKAIYLPRYRMFQVHYVSPTETRGSRIQIKDLRKNKSKFIQYDDSKGRTDEQAQQYLESIGISVDAMGMADKDSDCVFLSKNFETDLK